MQSCMTEIGSIQLLALCPSGVNPTSMEEAMNKKERREKVLNTVDDLVSKFLYYDRKEDEDISPDLIKEMFNKQEVIVDEVVEKFRSCLCRGLGWATKVK